MPILLKTQVDRTAKTPVTARRARVGGLCGFCGTAKRVPAQHQKTGRCANVREHCGHGKRRKRTAAGEFQQREKPQAASRRKGFEDARGTLFFELARVVKEKRPSYLFFENVPGLLSHDRGRTFGVILSTLYDLGYHVEWTVLNSKHFGVPQSRRRLFLIGYLDPRCAGKILPVFGADAKALVQIVHGRLGKRVYDSAGIACTQDTSRQSGLYFVDLTKGDLKITPNARCLHTRQDGSLTNFKGQNSGVLYIKEATKKGYKEAHEGDPIDLGFAGSNTRRGRVFAGVAHTVDTANTHGIVLRGGRVRRLMPRECFRLQGFSEDQIDKILAINSDAQAYKQAGNSVTVTVIEAIGRRIRAADTELHDKEEGRDVCPTM